MAWIICALLIGSLMYLFTPQTATPSNSHISGLTAINRPKLLMLPPLLILGWLAVRSFDMPFSFFTLAAVSFVSTSIVLLVPKWRVATLPLAFLSLASVLLGTIWG